jgi:long-chain acyl-CoA synthetase
MPARFSVLKEVSRHHADVRGAKIALRFEGNETNYASLHAHSLQVANGLQAAGVTPGSRVAYLGKNSAVYYEILFGAAAAGGVLVPVNWRFSDPEIEWILRDSNTVVLFADAEISGRLEHTIKTIPTLKLVIPLQGAQGAYCAWRDSQRSGDTGIEAKGSDVAVQLYTSGTTGKPKGAMLSHRALLAFRSLPPQEQPEWNRWNDDDVSLIVMPQFHIGGTGFGLQTLAAGATGLVMTEFNVEHILDYIDKEGLSKIFTVPTALQMILRHPRARQVDYHRIRTLVYGASPIPLELLREAMAVFDCGFVQQYGMTEVAGTICALPPADHDPNGNDKMLSTGKPLPGVDIRILDPQGASLGVGATGEVVIRSPTLMSGYWNSPEATAQAFTEDGFFRTGDAGMLDGDGYLYIKDRLKDMIVTGGENVHPAEVEAALSLHPSIKDVAVIGIPDDKWGEAVHAIVVPASAIQPDVNEILSWARGRLAGYKLPKSIEFVAELPRNASGKILRRALREPYWAGRARRVN